MANWKREEKKKLRDRKIITNENMKNKPYTNFFFLIKKMM